MYDTPRGVSSVLRLPPCPPLPPSPVPRLCPVPCAHHCSWQRPEDWRYILQDSGAKCLFVATKEVYRETYHFAGVQGNVQNVFCFEEPEGKPGSYQGLLNASKGKTMWTQRQEGILLSALLSIMRVLLRGTIVNRTKFC